MGIHPGRPPAALGGLLLEFIIVPLFSDSIWDHEPCLDGYPDTMAAKSWSALLDI